MKAKIFIWTFSNFFMSYESYTTFSIKNNDNNNTTKRVTAPTNFGEFV